MIEEKQPRYVVVDANVDNDVLDNVLNGLADAGYRLLPFHLEGTLILELDDDAAHVLRRAESDREALAERTRELDVARADVEAARIELDADAVGSSERHKLHLALLGLPQPVVADE